MNLSTIKIDSNVVDNNLSVAEEPSKMILQIAIMAEVNQIKRIIDSIQWHLVTDIPSSQLELDRITNMWKLTKSDQVELLIKDINSHLLLRNTYFKELVDVTNFMYLNLEKIISLGYKNQINHANRIINQMNSLMNNEIDIKHYAFYQLKKLGKNVSDAELNKEVESILNYFTNLNVVTLNKVLNLLLDSEESDVNRQIFEKIYKITLSSNNKELVAQLDDLIGIKSMDRRVIDKNTKKTNNKHALKRSLMISLTTLKTQDPDRFDQFISQLKSGYHHFLVKKIGVINYYYLSKDKDGQDSFFIKNKHISNTIKAMHKFENSEDAIQIAINF